MFKDRGATEGVFFYIRFSLSIAFPLANQSLKLRQRPFLPNRSNVCKALFEASLLEN